MLLSSIMSEGKEKNLKRLPPVLAFIFLLGFMAYFTLADLKIKKDDRITEAREKILQEARDAEFKLFLTGKFDPAQRDGFVLIPAKYAVGSNKIYLQKEAYAAYLSMRSAAKKDGIILDIASATRNFNYQKILWDNKWWGITYVDGKDLSKSIPDGLERFEKILEYSAAPGTSRHHWGTDIDLNAAIPSYFEAGKGKDEYDWLVKNAGKFGFCQTYDLKGNSRSTGYNEEKWHWSYLPLARDFTRKYKDLVKPEDIAGFQGDQYAAGQNLIENYVLSINQDCM